MPESDIILKVSADTTQVQNDMRILRDQMKSTGREAGIAGQKIDESFRAPGSEKLKKSYDDLNREISQLNKQLREELLLKNKNAAITGKRINTLQRERDAIEKQANALTKTKTAASALRGVVTKLGIAFSIAFVARKTVRFFQQSVEASKRFESGLANLSALTGLTGTDLAFLGRKAKELSTSIREDGIQITSSAEDIVVAFTKMGSAQPELLKNKEALAEVTEAALVLGEAAKLDAETAIVSLASAMNQFGADASQATKFVNTLAAGSKFGAQTVDFVSQSLTKFGAAAAAFNIPIEESVALIETMAEKGIQAEVSGTGIRTFLLRLAEGADDTNPKVVGLSTALDNLADQNLSAAEMTKRFGQEGFLAAQILITEKDRVNELTSAVTGTNTAFEQAAVNTQTLESTTKRLGNLFDNLQEAIGKRFTGSVIKAGGVLGKFLQKVTKWIEPKVSEQLEEQITKVNTLATSLSNANLPAERRKNIYNELKSIAPEVVAGMNAENVNLVALTKNLAKYNKQAIDRLTITLAHERMQERQDEASEANLEWQERQITAAQTFIELEKELIKTGGGQVDLLATTRENFQKGAIDLWEYARVVKVATEAVWADERARKANFKILTAANTQLGLLADAKEEDRVLTQEAAEAATFYEIIQNKLGLTYDKATEGLFDMGQATIDETDATGNNTDAKKEQLTIYEKLSKEIDELNKKLKDQILLGDDQSTATFNLIQAKQKELDAVQEEIDRLNLLIKLRADISKRIKQNTEDIEEDVTLSVGIAPPGTGAADAQAAEVADGMANILAKGREKAADEIEDMTFTDSLISKIFGLDDPEQIDAVKNALEDLVSTLGDSLEEILLSNVQAQVEILDRYVSNLDQAISEQRSKLQEQEQLNKEGAASNIRVEQERLDELNRLREKALDDRRKQAQKERDIQRTLAVVKGVVAATEAIAQNAGTGPGGWVVGLIAAATVIAEIATLFATADNSIKFEQGTAQILGGKRHSQGGVNLGDVGEAEGGEFLGILSRSKTQKYGKAMTTLFDGINENNAVKAQMGLLQLASAQPVERANWDGQMELKEVPEIKGIYNEIRKQNKTVTHEGKYRVEKFGNTTRKIYVN